MKRVLIDLWFPNDYYVQNMKGQLQNQNYHSQFHVSNKGNILRVEKKQPLSKENFEVVKKD